jgi:two-component system response regulator LytT
MTALIIEDEIPAGKRLEKLLLENNFIVLQHLHSVKQAVHWFKENAMPDYVFMDIELADGTCFELFEKVKIESKVIFTTAYNEYALKAFDYNAIDYLLKPIDEVKLKKMLSKVSFLKETVLSEMVMMKTHFTSTFKKSFIVPTSTGVKKITTDEIVGFISENNATFLIGNNNVNYAVDTSLEKWEGELDSTQFFRINRKFIVHKKFIKEVLNSNEIVLDIPMEHDLKISRTKRKLFLEWYEM